MNRRIKFGVFITLLSAVLVTCGVMVGEELLSRQKEKEDFEELAKLVTVEKPSISPVPSVNVLPGNSEFLEESPAEGEPAPARDLSELFAMNEDFVGWLCIPDTDINYPVMYTPNDPEKYLRRDFQGEYSESGVPFLDFRCSLDSENVIIYGHNMMNGTMFAALQGYVQGDFCKAHPIVEFQTADGCAEYQVFAVAWVKSNDEWYKFVGANSAKDFNSAVEKIIGEALFQVGSSPEFDTQSLIQEHTGGDLFLIETKEKYPADYDETDAQARQENSENARPELAVQVENLEQYDTVFLGFANWYYGMPMAVYSFLESHDLSGKTIVPFATSGGSGFSNAISVIQELQPNATVIEDGFLTTHSQVEGVQSADVQAWLESLPLN